MGCAFLEFDITNGKSGKPVGFVSGPGIEPCVVCGMPADFLCDYPVGRRRTCDQPLCEKHRIHQGAEWQDIDFCPTHVLIATGTINSLTFPPQPTPASRGGRWMDLDKLIGVLERAIEDGAFVDEAVLTRAEAKAILERLYELEELDG